MSDISIFYPMSLKFDTRNNILIISMRMCLTIFLRICFSTLNTNVKHIFNNNSNDKFNDILIVI